MSLSDKFEDLKLYIKSDRKIWFFVGFCAFCLLVFMMTNDSQSGGKKRTRSKIPEKQTNIAADNTVDDLMKSMKQQLNDVDVTSKASQQELMRLGSKVDENQKRTASIFTGILDDVEKIRSEVKTLGEQVRTGAQTDPMYNPDGDAQQQSDDLETVFFNNTNVPEPPVRKPSKGKMTFISPGDAVPVQLLSGVNAPVDGTPYPVVFQLGGAITGPDGSTLDLGEARLIGAAQGSEVDGRVLFRLTSMSMRHKDGRRSVAEVDGWVVGEDGVRGMKGKVIDKLAETIVAIATAGTLGAAANKMLDGGGSTNNSSDDGGITINSGTAEDSIGEGLNAATQRLVDVIIQRHQKLIPVVEVLSGRQAVAVFSQPVEISPCGDNCGDESIYASLD